MRETLFVQGIQKTGTSTLVGILNCHPEIFVLYETRLDRALISNYGNQLLTRFPGARRFFRNTTDIAKPYREFFDWLENSYPEFSYRYGGDKIIDFDPALTQRHSSGKVIFTMRDLRSWLCKEQIQKYYRTDLDVVPATIELMKYVVGSHGVSGSHRVWLEDMIKDNRSVIAGLSEFLNLDLLPYTGNWWEQISRRDDADPKKCIGWHKGHPSSKLAPQKLDTQSVIKPHPFWDAVLPLCVKYRQAEEPPASEITEDVSALEGLVDFAPLPLDQCFESIVTTRLGTGQDQSVQTDVDANGRRGKSRSLAKRFRRLFRPGKR